MPDGRPKNYWQQLKKVPCKNASGVNTVPAFGLVRVVGQNSDGTLSVDQPNADGQDVLVNGPTPIGPNGYGAVSRQWPLYAAYTGGPPAAGQTWGAANGSYLLTSGKGGLVVQAADATSCGRVLVAPPMYTAASAATTITVTCGGSALTCSDLVLDSTVGFGISNGGSGAVDVTQLGANASVGGCVLTTAQTWAGNKTLSGAKWGTTYPGGGYTLSYPNGVYATATGSIDLGVSGGVSIQGLSSNSTVGGTQYGQELDVGDSGSGNQYLSYYAWSWNGTSRTYVDTAIRLGHGTGATFVYEVGATGTGADGTTYFGGICTGVGTGIDGGTF